MCSWSIFEDPNKSALTGFRAHDWAASPAIFSASVSRPWPLDTGDHDEMTSPSHNMSITPEWFLERVNENLVIAALIERLPALGLDQYYLTAGCLCQTVWNFCSGLPLQTMIKDYDAETYL
jgi:nucleotidyltransferase-like protein